MVATITAVQVVQEFVGHPPEAMAMETVIHKDQQAIQAFATIIVVNPDLPLIGVTVKVSKVRYGCYLSSRI